MTTAVLTLLTGLLILGALLVWRQRESKGWNSSLSFYSLGLPRDLSPEAVADWLGQVAAITRPPRWSLAPLVPVGLEVGATGAGITHTLLVPQVHRTAVLASLRAALPAVRIEELTDTPLAPRLSLAVELRLTSPWVPLADDRAAATATALLAALWPFPSGGGHLRAQWLFTGVRSSRPIALKGSELTSQQRREIERKQRLPLLAMTGRLGATSGEPGWSAAALRRMTAALRGMDRHGVEVARRRLRPAVVARRMTDRVVPTAAWPIVVNAAEASGLLGLPYGVMLPGLTLGVSRTVPPSNALPARGVVIGESTYPGSGRLLAMSSEDRLKHTYILGTTGVGKSHLLASMVLQEVSQGFGGLVVDPKADLIDAIVSRLDEKDRERTVILDPADTAMPVGINPLALGGSEQQRELAAETTVTILRSIFRAYWGPRTDDLARAAVNSLTQVPAPDGSAFTLSEVAELLTNGRLRHYVSSHSRLDERWRDYWQWYNSLSEGERLNAIGPVLNKLRSFTTRTSLRLMFGQSDGFDFSRVFTERKLVLVPLARGEIGAEAAALFGAFVTGALWHATTRRANVPADQRRPAFAYLDEFQNVVRFTDDISDMAAEARGLGLGLTLANQYVNQLPPSIRAAVLGTVRSHIFFQVEHDDARLLGERLAPVLAASDLSGLGRFEIIARLNLSGQTHAPMTGRTLPLPEPLIVPARLRRELATRWGTPRADVETALRSRRFGNVTPLRLGEVPREEQL